MNKYRNVPTQVNGEMFDSKKEAARWQELLLLQRGKRIGQIFRQPAFPLEVNGVKIGVYYADFQYRDLATNQVITEDVKGMRTPTYQIKKKLVKALYGIDIVEL